MLRYAVNRLLMMAVTVIGMVTVAFFLLRAIPGDPAAYFAGPAATPQAMVPDPAMPTRSGKPLSVPSRTPARLG